MENLDVKDKLLIGMRGEIAALDAKVKTIFQMLVRVIADQSEIDVNLVHEQWVLARQDLFAQKFAEMPKIVAEEQNL